MKFFKNHLNLSVFLLFCVLSLSLFWPIFLGKVNLNGNLLVSFYPPFGQNLPFKDSGWDQLRIYFPFLRITIDAFRHFSVPLWNPYAFSGHPHMADFQAAVFYPLNFVGVFLPQIEFWHLLRITPMILGSFFTFLFLNNLKVSKIAAFFGAFSFGFSPFILTWGEEVVMSPHSIIWMPLILFSIDRFLEKKDKKYLILIALSTAFSFLGGYMQTSIYLFIFVFLYLILRQGKGFVLSIKGLRLVGAFIVGTAIASLQILPSAQLFFNGARSQIALTSTLFQFLLPARSLATYLAPDFFGNPATRNFFRGGSAQYYEGIMFVGIASLIFAIFALLKKPKDKFVIFLLTVGLVSLSSTLDLPTSRLFLTLPIPFLSTSIANRILFIPAFCLCILAALGMNEWLRGKDKRIFFPVTVLSLMYFALFSYLFGVLKFGFPYLEHAGVGPKADALISLRNLVMPVLVFAITSVLIVLATFKTKIREKAAIVLIAIFFLQTFYFAQKYFSFSDRQYVFPQTPLLKFIENNQGYFRSWGVGNAYLENNFASQYSIWWPEGYDSLNNKSYAEFTYGMQGNNIDDFSFRADAGLGRGDTRMLFEDKNRRKLMDLLGIKYVIGKISDSNLLLANNLSEVFSDGQYGVFENNEVMPRVFLASNYEGPPEVDPTNKTTDEINALRRKLIPQKLLANDFDFRNVIVLEKPSPISAQYGPGSAEIVSYKPQEVVVKTDSEEPKLLFLSDNYYPGWKATVDGSAVDILRADYTFRAVALVPGKHTVRFYYSSDVFKLGELITLAGLGFLVFVILRRNPLTD